MKSHLFICTNTKTDGESCGAKGSTVLRDAVKKQCHMKLGKSKEYRVNASGCLGKCEEGIAAVIYPEGKWFTKLLNTDIEKLVAAVEESMKR
ncbi:MAG: (2Fe-2S) ferredoxin domain-containing protein [Xanthomonadaceae bacterium]|nr:(2Fe-2S) ferredoxin domain-containing protein [Xanthomonadaceae bacterium]